MARKGMLRDGVWLRHAGHANWMAALLHDLVSVIPGAKVLFPRQVNSVFVDLPKPVIEGLRNRGWLFYSVIGEGGCRFMCSWDTREEDVRAFAADLAEVTARGELRVAVAPLSPFVIRSDDGALTGFEIDAMTAGQAVAITRTCTDIR